MAIQEYVAETSPSEERSEQELFQDGLREMVVTIENTGRSALPELLEIRAELRAKKVDLLRRSLAAEHLMKSGGQSSLSDELSEMQNQALLVFHNEGWLEGFIRDRQ